jgi:DNA polymerase-1
MLLESSELTRLAEAARSAGRLALEVALEPDSALRGGLVGLALSVEPGHAAYVPLGHRYVGAPRQLPLGEVLAVLGPVLADPKVQKVGRDLKRIGVALARSGQTLEGFGFDVALASYLIDPEARHDREALAERELGIPLKPLEALTSRGRGRRVAFDELTTEEATPHVAASADLGLRLAERLRPRLVDAGLERLFEWVVQRMPVRSKRSLTKWRQAPSATPLPIG